MLVRGMHTVKLLLGEQQLFGLEVERGVHSFALGNESVVFCAGSLDHHRNGLVVAA